MDKQRTTDNTIGRPLGQSERIFHEVGGMTAGMVSESAGSRALV